MARAARLKRIKNQKSKIKNQKSKTKNATITTKGLELLPNFAGPSP
jgi:hypothetical protein